MPPSLHSDFARSTFQVEFPDSVVSVGAPQAALASSIHCSKNLVSEGLGNCLANSGNFPVGSLPVNPSPSIEGGLNAGALPLAYSSPPHQCEPCPSSVMSAVAIAPASLSAPCGALQICPEAPRNSPAATPPPSADAGNHGVSCEQTKCPPISASVQELRVLLSHPLSRIEGIMRSQFLDVLESLTRDDHVECDGITPSRSQLSLLGLPLW
ncbi:hypothetical protein Nepgr_012518 [Nepenthes gracilis]|uniref:Uncharacterized protein n=1 Tax=Nepenthes gracilis TaxID=150966 RepID=A0AAD3XMV5_NEPGR|nr:hypothetical protein Nepgr_012518 [Nepenthes gracilis]